MMIYYYISAAPFIVYWVTSLFIELFVEEDVKDKIISNGVSKKRVFINTFFATLSTVAINILIVDLNILPKENCRLEYIFLGIWWIDTVEYFIHRVMHSNSFLYKNCHKTHHELHDTYSFGSLYNGFFEHCLTSPTIFFGIYYFGFSFSEYIIISVLANIATIIDHTYINYKNRFHYLHHSKYHNYNFQQPFFTYYDRILGTYKC